MNVSSLQSAPSSELITRILSGIVFVVVTAMFTYLGGWAFTAFVATISAISVYELVRLLRWATYNASISAALLSAAAGFIGVRWPEWMILAPALSIVLLASLAWQLRQSPSRKFGDWAASFAGGLYLGWTGGHLAELREIPNGLWWVALALVAVWLADSGAYVFGRLFGRHKLIPRISPGKTWEGYFGGVVVACAGGAVLGALSPIGLLIGSVAGLLVGAFSVLGDLIESMIKREAHAKDSGSLIPGHGGVFDRIDSLLWAAVIVFYVWMITGGRL